ncbi:MAG: PA domain-containing protein [Micromonosporaceae bacterium]
MTRSRLVRVLAGVAVAGVVFAGIGPAQAHEIIDDGGIDDAKSTHDHDQHGGTGGHLPASSENVDLVGKGPINQDQEGRVADVGVFGNYAYLGAFSEPSCQKGGVYVFDISNVAQPKQVNFIRTGTNSYVGEGVQVVHIDTPKYTGDVLAMNNEICGDKSKHSTAGGMSLVDVTNPKSHKYLVEGFGDNDVHGTRANEIHSVFIWDAGDKAYAVLVDDEEATDVDIVDITDPRNPSLIAEYDLAAQFPQILQQGLDEVFLHDMIVKEINGKQVMLLSYWDAGYVTLDVTNPTSPVYLGDTDFTDPDPELEESTGDQRAPEGNGHQAEFTLDNRYVIGADEDFSPFALTGTNDTDGTEIAAGQGSNTKPLEPGQTISGQAKFAGRACAGDPAPPTGDGTQIAVVERGVCTFTEKVANVEAAGGYAAILIFNRTASDGCNSTLGMSVEGGIPTFGVAPREQGFNIFGAPYDDAECEAGDGTQLAPIEIGTLGDTLTFTSYFDGWGYVHLYDNTGGKLAELDTYALPEAHDIDHATGSGDLSVHEVATSGQQADLAYFAYYAGGFRVTRIQDGKLVETGHFIDQGGNNFWGVQIFERDGVEYVAASDRDYGLYIFRYTGP